MGSDAPGITVITSRDNPKIKQVRALRQRKERAARGLFLVEGIRHVGECAIADAKAGAAAGEQALVALDTGESLAAGAVRGSLKTRWLEYICYSPELLTSDFALALIQDQARQGLPCYSLPAELFISLAEKENPQGILAVARQRSYDLEALNPEGFAWGVALVAPQDPGNIGAILRTVDAVGASGLLLLESSTDPYHPNSVRASMGTIFWHPIVCASFSRFTRWAKLNGYRIIGTSAHGSQDYRMVSPYTRPLILLMGSEREGLTDEQKAACDVLACIPMQGRVSSLNLAVATGIMLYTLLEKLA
jgi:TrmH family RNA methyltransferase